MKLAHITATTDGKYLGELIDIDLTTLRLGDQDEDDPIIEVESKQNLGGGMWRLSNSNYVIDAIEV